MPIADVAGDTAGRAALEEVAREMTVAEEEGRVIKKLALKDVTIHHLARDRMVMDADEMEALKASIAERGQQTPIEVVRLLGGKFGLISGLRRVEALRALGQSDVLALIKLPEGSHEAYRAMVEENEIRAGLSFYERANIAVAAVGQEVYPDPKAAVKELFANAPKAKRSKILKFVILRQTLGNSLTFPTAIPEHLGISLAQAIAADRRVASEISARLKKAAPKDAAEERAVLEAVLKPPSAPKPARKELVSGLFVETKAGRAVLSGPKVDAAFLEALEAWAARQAS
jgi:ParB family chromosome partitioning protein